MSTYEQALKERRFKAFYVDNCFLLQLLNIRQPPEQKFIELHSLRHALPEDAAVLAIHEDPARDALRVLVAHPSFEPVALGAVVPSAGPIDRRTYKIKVEHLAAETLGDDLTSENPKGAAKP